MNIVEFAIKFKDLASGELGKFGNQSRQTFAMANKYAEQMTMHNKILGSSYSELQAKIRAVETTIKTSTIPSQIRAARKELEALQRQSNNHIGNINGISAGKKSGNVLNNIGLSSMAKLATPVAIGAGIMELGSFISESFGKSLERQKIQTSFNVLAGGNDAGKQITQQLVSLQKDTIMGTEVFKNAQTMMAFGESSQSVAKDLKMLGDITMGDKERLSALTLAFSQSQATGRLMGQDLLQMVNAGFNPLQVISEKTGKSMGQLKSEMEKGQIPFSMVKQAMLEATSEGGKFYNMLEKIGNTPAGKLEQLKGNWQEFSTQAGTALMPLVSFAIDIGNKLMPIINGFIKPLGEGLNKLSIIATGIWDKINGLKVSDEFMNLVNIGDKFYQSTAVPLIGVFRDVKNMISSITEKTGGWGDYVAIIKDSFINSIYPFIQKVFSGIVHIVSKIIEWIGHSQLLKDVFKGIYDFLGFILKMAGGLISNIIELFDKTIFPVLKFLDAVYVKLRGGKPISIETKSKAINITSNTTQNTGDTNTELLRQTAVNTAENAKSSRNAEKAVSNGGQKTINVTVGKFLDSINLHTANLKEGTADIEGIFLEMFARVVAQGAKAM